MKRYYWIFLLFLMACQGKIEPLEIEGRPSFYLQGSIDGQNREFIAGKNSYYLNTNSQKESDTSPQVMSAVFEPKCPNCKEKLSITLRDYQLTGLYNPDSSFKLGRHGFYQKDKGYSSAYFLHLYAEGSGSSPLLNHQWKLNEEIIKDSSELHRKFFPGEAVSITYTSDFGACVNSLSYRIKFYPNMVPENLPGIQYYRMDSSNSIFKFEASGDPNASYYWLMGDGTKLTGRQVFYGYATEGNFNITLFQIIGGDTNEVRRQINTRQEMGCLAHFSATIIPLVDNKSFSTIKIDYTDEQGNTYTSENINQSFDSYFNITKQEPGLINEPGKATRSIELKFSAKVKGSNGIKIFNNWKGKIAMGEPN